MYRRHLLAILGATFSGGCLSQNKSSTSSALGQIDIVNHDYEPHTVHILVERDSQPVYWADHEATARDDSSLGGANIPCVWGNETGHYIVRARLDDRNEWQSINLADYDSEILGLKIAIGDETTEHHETPELTIWHAGNPNERCGSTDPTTESSSSTDVA